MVKLEELMEPSFELEDDKKLSLWNYTTGDLVKILDLYHNTRKVLAEEKPILGYAALVILLSECLRLYDRKPKEKANLITAVRNDLGKIADIFDIAAASNAPSTSKLQ
jgi:hypothetical protein